MNDSYREPGTVPEDRKLKLPPTKTQKDIAVLALSLCGALRRRRASRLALATPQAKDKDPMSTDTPHDTPHAPSLPRRFLVYVKKGVAAPADAPYVEAHHYLEGVVFSNGKVVIADLHGGGVEVRDSLDDYNSGRIGFDVPVWLDEPTET